MAYFAKVFVGFFILIPGLIGLFRLKKIHNSYYTFIFLLWVGIVNECVGNLTAWYFRTTAVNSNIYCLAESLLITHLFNKWRLFSKPIFFNVLIFLLPLIWFTENFIIGNVHSFNSFFTVFYSFIIVLESIAFINKTLISERQSLLKNAQFLICGAFTIFFTYTAFIEIWWKYGSVFSDSFNVKLHNIFIAINLFVNILFSYAILCMRPKPPSLMQL